MPTYPVELLNANVVGSATVAFLVSEDGSIKDVVNVKDTHPEFGESAKQAIRQWRFIPATSFHKPTSLQIEATFTFSIYEEKEPNQQPQPSTKAK